ncbi:MAG: hypothetical protein KatS3mg132_014 [Limisphaera sp.]|nr:MAG: hypothetical protein KatS3mg132_014 [Limisphaera sp.]
MSARIGPSVRTIAEGTPYSSQLWYGVCQSFEDLPFGQAEWDAASERLGGSVYMTWDWVRTWWDFYGEGSRLALFWFTRDGEIVGLLPLYIRRLGPPGLGLTVARLVGANIPPKVFNPPICSDLRDACLGIMADVLTRQGCDLISLGPVSQAHPAWSRWDPCAYAAAAPFQAERVSTGVHTLFRLANDLETYMARLGKNEQKNRRKYELKMLKKEYPVRVLTLQEPGTALEDAFHRFVRLHRAQWQAEGLTGHFGGWPRGAEYNLALVRTQAPHGRVRLMEIWAGDELVCGQYAFAWGNGWFWELPARSPDPRWQRFSLGPSGLMMLFAQAIQEGYSFVEGGLGHYDYKLRLGGEEHPVWAVRFLKKGRAPALRRLVHSCIQRALRIGYHKVWYRRIQPRLPDAWKRPQWRLWLRYDF